MANVYEYGGTANWSSATGHWSNNSGNTPAADRGQPTSSEDVVLDTLSNATAYTITVDASSVCRDLTIGAPASGKVTFAGSQALAISGSLNMSGGTAGITRSYTGTMTFNATSGTKTITSNGIVFGNPLIINGPGGTFQLSDDYATQTNGAITLTAGTFDPNGKNFTFTAAGATNTINGSWSFYDLSLVPSAANKTNIVNLASNETVTHNLTITGNSVINRVLLASNAIGTPRTVTAAALTVDKGDFRDITAAGAGNWDFSGAAGYSGDCGGNTGITFTTPATCNWSAGTTWSTATWSNHSVPLPQDTATFTTAGTVTITQDMPRIGSVDFSTSANKTWTTSTACEVYGSINLTNLAALTASTQTYTLCGRGSYTLTNAGFTWAKAFTIDAPGGTYTCSDNFNIGANRLRLNSGTFDTNGKNITASDFLSTGSTTRVLTHTGGTMTLSATGAGAAWNVSSTGFTFNKTGGTVEFTGAAPLINTSSKAMGTVNFTGTNPTITVQSGNGFTADACSINGTGTFTLDGSLAHWNVTTFTSNSSTVIWTGSGSVQITANGQSFYNITVNKTAGQALTMQDALTVSNLLTHTQGTFSANNFAITAKKIDTSNSNTRTLTLGNATHHLTGTGTVFDASTSTNLTVTATTSTIVIDDSSATSKTFAGGGKAYGSITLNANTIITGANTFATIAVNNADDTTGVTFPASTTTTVTGFTTNGSAGHLSKIISSADGSPATLSKSSGIVSVDYMYIKDSAATGGALWYAGANSVDGGGNTGWIFTAPPTTAIKTLNSLPNASVKTVNGLARASVKTWNGLE